jgi:hypothetical protein
VKLFLLLTQLAELISLQNFLYWYISYTQIIFLLFGFRCRFQIWFQVPHTKFSWKGINEYTYWSRVLMHWLKSTAIRFDGVSSLYSPSDWGQRFLRDPTEYVGGGARGGAAAAPTGKMKSS